MVTLVAFQSLPPLKKCDNGLFFSQVRRSTVGRRRTFLGEHPSFGGRDHVEADEHQGRLGSRVVDGNRAVILMTDRMMMLKTDVLLTFYDANIRNDENPTFASPYVVLGEMRFSLFFFQVTHSAILFEDDFLTYYINA